jgi:hypothetical protein
MTQEITKTHIKNLTKLRDFLGGVSRDRFEMSSFMGNEDYSFEIQQRKKIHQCGTAACAVGYGPSAGVRVGKDDQTWQHYSARVFGYTVNGDDWEYMFSGSWDSYDNTPEGAAKRIGYVIEHGGAPAGWDFYEPFPVQEAA